METYDSSRSSAVTSPRMTVRSLNDKSRSIQIITNFCEQIVGYSKQELLADGLGLLDITLPADREYVCREVRESTLAVKPLDISYRMQAKDGTIVSVQERCFPSMSDGQILFIGFIQELHREEKTPSSVQTRLASEGVQPASKSQP